MENVEGTEEGNHDSIEQCSKNRTSDVSAHNADTLRGVQAVAVSHDGDGGLAGDGERTANSRTVHPQNEDCNRES